MKETDLRIGNWFKTFEIDKDHGEEYFQIESFSQNKEKTLGVEFRNGSCWSIVELIDPIPLTEEWLVKFGFEVKPNRAYEKYWKDFGDMAILVDEDLEFYIHAESYEGETLRKVEHVHTLQNLFFALTGEELEIK